MTNPEPVLICLIDDIPDPGSRGFSLSHDGTTIDGFVVHHNGAVYAYHNRCPHTGSPLDWVEHQFLDLDKAFIQCAVHDARFQVEDGLCVAGPCPGERLESLEVSIKAGAVYLDPSSAGKPGEN